MYKGIDKDVSDAINNNFKEYSEHYLSTSKLSFIKLLKKQTSLGLKDCKDQADIIFMHGYTNFKNNFGVVALRKAKLTVLKGKLLSVEFVKVLRRSSDEDVANAISQLKYDDIEKIMEFLIENE